MEIPETRYTESGDVHIAYQVLGDGPFDLVFIPGLISHLEHGWLQPDRAAFLRRLASFSRLIIHDKRGVGLSDRVTGGVAFETRMDDVAAVMDAASSSRAALVGIADGAAIASLFAATYPRRALALVLLNPLSRLLWAPDYPWGTPRDEFYRQVDSRHRVWGRERAMEAAREAAPSLAQDQEFLDWYYEGLRLAAGPGGSERFFRDFAELDVRGALPLIQAPTLVVERGDASGDLPNVGRYVADQIPGARYVDSAGEWIYYDAGGILDEMQSFLTGVWGGGDVNELEPDRVLATVLFTDVVDSTAKAIELGDAGWRDLVRDHHALVRRQLSRFRGRELDTAGDGFFATSDGPARAIRCASAITEGVRALGLEVRAGLHTGECELIEGKVGGIAVVIGARVAANAGPGEVLVSQTVKDLVAGSGLEFDERGARELKGIPGEWRLYAVRP